MGKKLYDWTRHKTEYVTGEESYQKMAARIGCAHRVLAERAQKDGWVQARREYRAKIAKLAVEKAAKREAGKLDHIMAAADNMAMILEELSDGSHRFMSRNYITSADGETMEVVETVNARDIRDFTTAIRDMTYVMRNIYDIPNAMQKQKMRIEEERWALEKKALEAEIDPDSNRIEVVVSTDLEDYTV